MDEDFQCFFDVAEAGGKILSVLDAVALQAALSQLSDGDGAREWSIARDEIGRLPDLAKEFAAAINSGQTLFELSSTHPDVVQCCGDTQTTYVEIILRRQRTRYFSFTMVDRHIRAEDTSEEVRSNKRRQYFEQVVAESGEEAQLGARMLKELEMAVGRSDRQLVHGYEEEGPFQTKGKLAHALGVSESTIDKLVKNNQVEKRTGNKWYIVDPALKTQ